MDQLFIRLSIDPAETLYWVRRHASTPGSVESGGFEAAAEAAKGCQVIMLVPAEQVLLKKAEVPARQTSQLRKAVPYALEDELAADISELHFALGPRKDDITPVAVVDRRLMEGWIGLCRAHSIQPQAILPDMLTLPWQENSWSILLDSDQALVRTGLHSGFSCEQSLLDTLLAAELENDTGPEKVSVWLCDEQKTQLALPLEGIETKALACPDGALSVMAQGWQSRQGVDLQQGEFRNRPDIAKKLQPWRWAAIIFAAFVAISFGKMLLELKQLDQHQSQLTTQIGKEFKKAFPGAKKVSNVRARMERELKSLLGGGGGTEANALALLAASSKAITAQKDAKLEAINFRNNRLELQISTASLSQLDELRQAIGKEAGATAELSSANSDKNRARGQIRVSR